jgi:hypothetical protein
VEGSRPGEDGLNRPRVATKAGCFFAQAFAARGRQRVVAGAPVVLRRSPLRLNEPLAVEPVQRLVQGRILYRQFASGSLVDQRRNAVAVKRTGDEGPQYQQVERIDSP